MRPRVLYLVALLLVAILAGPACAVRNHLDWGRQARPDQSVVEAHVRLGEVSEAERYLRWFRLDEPEIMSRLVKAREKVRAEDARRLAQEGGGQ